MPDQFTEITRRSWGGRIAGSFVGVLVGILLFVASFPLIIWNESRSVDRIRTLGEGRGAVVSVGADKIDAANEGALVHVSGPSTTADVLKDPVFGIELNALKLSRTVEMYQWKENSSSKITQNLGGSETTETTYTYEKVWSASPINSSSFKQPSGHQNPAMPYASETFAAPNITLGAFRLSEPFVSQISGWQGFPVTEQNLDAAEPEVYSTFQVHNGTFYRGNVSNPQVGALRVSFRSVVPQDASAVGMQQGDGLATFKAKNGTINLLEMGTVSASDMFATAEAENKIITWIIRFAGFAMMWIGLSLVLGPISVIGSVIPFIGNLLGAGTGFVSFVLALVLSFVTAAIAWMAFRPVIGLTLLAIAVFFLLGGVKWLKGRAAGAAQAPGVSTTQYGRPPA